MKSELITRILNEYGLKSVRLLPAQKGYRNRSHPILLNNNTYINLIIYKTEPEILARITSADAVSNFAARHGLPTRQRIGPLLRLKTHRTTAYGGLYTYLPGSTIPWEAYTMEHLKALGAALSNLHATLKTYPGELESTPQQYRSISRRMWRYLAKEAVVQAMQDKLNLRLAPDGQRYESLLAACQQLPTQQALHMDFVRGNVLFTEKRITGIIDFEKTGRGHPMLDIARTLAFLLVDCAHKDPEKVRKYFLYSGYYKRGTSEYRNIVVRSKGVTFNLLEELITFFLLYDLYKFLRHNPYEYLHQNEHYVRTRDLLVDRQAIL